VSDDGDGSRRARVETSHAEPATVAAALAPDDTEATRTRAVDGAVVATVERPTTGGLAATVDDHLVNLGVAERVVAATRARRRGTAGGGTERSTDADADANTDTETEDT
jgi:pyrimidine deaminase RibD-like protein